jgi:acetoin utilization deacetylase AcuC-like enzyme
VLVPGQRYDHEPSGSQRQRTRVAPGRRPPAGGCRRGPGSLAGVTVLVAAHPEFLRHDTGPGHPERAARLGAVDEGLRGSAAADAIVRWEPSRAPRDAIERVHPGRYVDRLEELTSAGGGPIDADTTTSAASLDAARRAAGAGLEAIARLDAGGGSAAFCAVRPPGHHATPARPMGFCLLNSAAITATALADRGERVLVVDVDAHHGNGTQDVFYGDPRVVYVSFHEWPLYPGTGALDEVGEGAGVGATVNVPLPAGATGDVVRDGIDRVVVPLAERWQPTWLVLSTGFDAHRRDPLTRMGLSSGDYGDITAALLALVPEGRRVAFLEGGYDLDAVRASSAATLSAMAGVAEHPEAPTSGGPGRRSVDAAVEVRRRLDDGWRP